MCLLWWQLLALVVLLALTPFRAIGDKLVWSKVRAGLGGKVSHVVGGWVACSTPY